MKKNIVLRVLAALAGVTLAALGIGMLGETLFGLRMTEWLGRLLALRGFAVLLPIAAALAVIALSVGCIGVLIPRRRKHKRNFVMQKGENGTIGISLRSIEGLVQTCVQKHEMIEHADVRITETRQGLIIRLDVDQAAGVNIPLAVGLLQKQVRQYVSACTGVDVLEVRVMVENNGADAPRSPYAVSDGMGEAMMAPVAAAAASEAADWMEMPEEPAQLEAPAQEDAVPVEAAETVEEAPVLPDLSVLDETALPEGEMIDAMEEDEEERPLHQRLFGAEEQPVTVPAPPELVAEPASDMAEEAAAADPEEMAATDEEAAAVMDEATEEAAETAETESPAAENVPEAAAGSNLPCAGDTSCEDDVSFEDDEPDEAAEAEDTNDPSEDEIPAVIEEDEADIPEAIVPVEATTETDGLTEE